jgi:hypothetical protein
MSSITTRRLTSTVKKHPQHKKMQPARSPEAEQQSNAQAFQTSALTYAAVRHDEVTAPVRLCCSLTRKVLMWVSTVRTEKVRVMVSRPCATVLRANVAPGVANKSASTLQLQLGQQQAAP